MFMTEAREGAVVKTKVDVRDEAGNLVCTNYSTTFFHEPVDLAENRCLRVKL